MQPIKLKLSEIKPYWKNPRDNEAAVPALMQSLKSFGQEQPLVLDSERVIITGHTRYKAMARLGWSECWVLISDLSPEDARAYRIIDNKTSEKATWHIENLIGELRALPKIEVFHGEFPELKLEDLDSSSFGVKYEPITGHEISAQASKNEQKYNEITQARTQSIQQITCPECDHRFEIQ